MIKLRGYGRSIVSGSSVVAPSPATLTSWPGQNVAYIMPGEGTLMSKQQGIIETLPSPIGQRSTMYVVRESRQAPASRRTLVPADVITMGEKPFVAVPPDMTVLEVEEPTSQLSPATEMAQDLPTDAATYETEGEVSATDMADASMADTGIDMGQEEFGVESKTNWWLWGSLIAGGIVVAGTVGYLAYKESKKRKKGRKS